MIPIIHCMFIALFKTNYCCLSFTLRHDDDNDNDTYDDIHGSDNYQCKAEYGKNMTENTTKIFEI